MIILDPKQALEVFCKNTSFQENTKKNWSYDLNNFFEFTDKDNIEDITTDDIKEWLVLLDDIGYQPTTINKIITMLKIFFRYFHEEEETLPEDCTEEIKRVKVIKKLPRTIDHNTLNRLREVSSNNIRNHAIIETLYCTGVRASELINIKIPDIRWDTKKIWISKGKGLKERFVYFNSICKEILKEYLETRTDNCSYLFMSARKQALSYSGLYHVTEEYSKLIGIHVTPIMFRRLFATTLINKGVPIELIAKLLGHEKMETTKIYLELAEAFLCAEYDQYL